MGNNAIVVKVSDGELVLGPAVASPRAHSTQASPTNSSWKVDSPCVGHPTGKWTTTGIRQTIAAVAAFYRIPWQKLIVSKKRRKIDEYIDIRHMAMWLARTHANASYPAMGRVFECHHTTVVHAVRRIDAIREAGVEVRLCNHLKAIKERLEAHDAAIWGSADDPVRDDGPSRQLRLDLDGTGR